MTVNELIEALQKIENKDKEVLVRGKYDDWTTEFDVEEDEYGIELS